VGLDRWLEVVGQRFTFQRHPFARIEIGGKAGDAGDVKRQPVPSSQGSLQLGRGFGNGATPRAMERFINQKAAIVI
jgi:hypothetical protein